MEDENEVFMAFPSGFRFYSPGMTLRDYFAAKALNGMIASGNRLSLNRIDVAAIAYDYADAMMEARKK